MLNPITPEAVSLFGCEPTTRTTNLPFHLDWLDALTGGGVAPGSVLLFTSPSGDGKTIFATQLAWAAATHGLGVHHLCYEGFDGDMQLRFESMASAVGKSELERTPLGQQPPDVQTRCREAYARARPHLKLYSLGGGRSGSGGIQEVAGLVDAGITAGFQASFIILDWLGLAVSRSLDPGFQRNPDHQAAMLAFVRAFRDLCRHYGVVGVLTHQLGAAHQCPTHILIDHTMTSGSRQLGEHATHAIGLTHPGRDGLSRVHLSLSPVPAQVGTTRVVRVNGAMNRIEDASAEYGWDEPSGTFLRHPRRGPLLI